jgi:hypothetical protein
MPMLSKSPPKMKPPAATPKPVPKRDDCWSDDETMEGFVVCIHGPMSAGKTFLAASASEHYPADLPAAKMVDLGDLYWGAADRGAVDGFKHNNIRVPVFNFTRFMGDRELWSKHFNAEPTIIQTANHFVRTAKERVVSGLTKTIVVDTLTTLDSHFFAYHAAKYAAHPNHYEAYKHNLAAHLLFHTSLCQTGANILYLFHSRAAGDESSVSEKAKQASVLVAGGARYVPDLTGAAPKFYKHDASLQLVMMATKEAGKKKLIRKVLIGLNDKQYEGKNRFEGLLNEIEEPNLKTIFQKIKRGK